LYAELPAIRRSVAALGLPKLYDPEVSGSLGGSVRVTGRLTTALPWSVAIRASDGSTVATGTGSGTAVDWTWDASGFPYGTFTYTVAGPNVRGWTASVPGPPPLAVQRLGTAPAVVTPNGDGVSETTRVSFVLTTAATVTAEVLNGSGAFVRRLANGLPLGAGAHRLRWDGRDSSGAMVPDGVYSIEVTAQSPGQSASRSRAVVVDRTLGFLDVSPGRFSPNGDGRLDSVGVTFALARAARVRVLVRHRDSRVATLQPAADLAGGSKAFAWDGQTRRGGRAADGRYRIKVEATTSLGTRVLSMHVRLDTKAPVVRIVRATAGSRRTTATITLDEAALLKVWFGRTRAVVLSAPPGTHLVSHRGVFRRVRATARDLAENRSALVRTRVSRR
jgi:flagellar hook assembly protein FlgD